MCLLISASGRVGIGRPTDVAFQINEGHPVTPPYGIYVPSGIQFRGEVPNNYTDQASSSLPFGGMWGLFSWAS